MDTLEQIVTIYGFSLLAGFLYLIVSWKFCWWPWKKET